MSDPFQVWVEQEDEVWHSYEVPCLPNDHPSESLYLLLLVNRTDWYLTTLVLREEQRGRDYSTLGLVYKMRILSIYIIETTKIKLISSSYNDAILKNFYFEQIC